MIMPGLTYRRGMMLFQTLVMSVILCIISVMVMQWVLGRHMVATRTYRSSASKIHTQGYSLNLFSNWQDNLDSIPPGGSTTIDGHYVSYTVSGSSNNIRTVTITTDEDQ